MIHAFRLGPTTSTGTPVHAYVGVAEGGQPRIHQATSDAEGLAALKAESPGQEIVCEEALADAAGEAGLSTAPLPAPLLPLRASLAYELATGIAHGASKPEAIAAFLEAAAAFWGAHTWELVAPEDRLHVLFEEGRARISGEVSVLGGDGTRFPGVALCDEPSMLKGLEALKGGERAEALLAIASMVIDMEREPAWAAEVIGEAYTLPRVPTPSRKRHGRVAAMVTADLVMAAALLRALAAYSEVEEGGHTEATVQAAGLSLRAALGPSAPPPSSPAEGPTVNLTPAREASADEAGKAAEVAAEAPPVPGPDAAPQAPAEPKGGATVAGAEEERAPQAAPEVATHAPAAAAVAAAPPAAPPAAENAPAAQLASPVMPAAPAAAPGPAPAQEPVPAPAKEPVLTRAKEPVPAPAKEPVLTPAKEPELTPVKPASPSSPAGPIPRAPPAPEPERPGWLSRAWSALRGGKASTQAEAQGRAPEKAPEEGAPAAKEPAVEVAPEPPHPFAAVAKALRIPIPAEPPPTPADDVAPQEQLAGNIQKESASAAQLLSFPAVALQIVELVHSPKADATSVAGFISRDPALAADVVRVANSAAFRGVSEVGSVRDAVARLGMEEVGRVASAVAARKLLDPGAGSGDKARRATLLFTRAVAVATAASAAALRQPGARSDHVWLGGLLHDVGRALALQALARLTAEGTDHLTSIAVAERALEAVHVQVGADALHRWGLPEWLQAIASRHHDEEVAASPENVDLHLVRLTSALAWLGEAPVAARAAREVLQSAAALRFGVAAIRALHTDLREAEKRAQALAH